MPRDYFAVLRQPRRPWLDPDQLKAKYQELTFALHPDRQKPGGEQADFSTITEAYRVLSNPRLRVLHLLSLEANATPNTSPTDISHELPDLFIEAANLIQQIDSYTQKREQTSSALGKSLLQAETAQVQTRADEMLKGMENRYDAALKDLRELDHAWTKDSSSVMNQLRSLADRFGYLDRWIDQLRERRFQLSS